MVQSLEQYVAEATNAYKPAQTAIQNQLSALTGQLDTANQQINKNYAQQQSGLDRQRNMAAESASLQAAGSGGSFGGSTNLANRRYYEKSFVPAQTQLQTNQANELAQTRQYYDNQRTNLNSQAANMEAQANQLALQKYWADVEAERQREWEAEQAAQSRAAQIAAAKASSPFAYMDDGYGNDQGVKTWDFGNGYKVYDNNGEAAYYYGNTPLTRGEFLQGSGANGTNWDLWKDIWASGTRTEGVGSDTIANISGLTGTNAAKYKGSDRYGYLWQ